MLQGEHSAILSTFIKLPLVICFVFFEWPFYTGFTVIVWLFFVTGIVKTEKEDHQHSTGTDPLEREATVCTGREPGTEEKPTRGRIRSSSGA